MSINITAPWNIRSRTATSHSLFDSNWWTRNRCEDTSQRPVLAAHAVLEKEDLDNLGIQYHRTGSSDK